MDGWENGDSWLNQTRNLVSGAIAMSPACKMLPRCYSHTLLTSQLLGWTMLPAEWHLPAWGNGAIFCHWINLPYDRQTEYWNTPGAQRFWLAFTRDISSMHEASIMIRGKRNQVYLLDKYLFVGLSAKGHFEFLLRRLELLLPPLLFLFSSKAQDTTTKIQTHRWHYMRDLTAKSHTDVDKYCSKSSRSVQLSYRRFLSR